MATQTLADRHTSVTEAARSIVEGVDFGEKGRISATALAKQIDKSLSTVLRWRFRGVAGITLPMRRLGAVYYVDAPSWGEFVRRLNQN